MNRSRKTSSWRGCGVPRTGAAATRAIATRHADANVLAARAAGTAAQNTGVPSTTGAPLNRFFAHLWMVDNIIC